MRIAPTSLLYMAMLPMSVLATSSPAKVSWLGLGLGLGLGLWLGLGLGLGLGQGLLWEEAGHEDALEPIEHLAEVGDVYVGLVRVRVRVRVRARVRVRVTLTLTLTLTLTFSL